MLDREQRVREIAHRLWEEEGRPTDHEKRHWAAAERIFDSEGPSSAGFSCTRATRATPPKRRVGAFALRMTFKDRPTRRYPAGVRGLRVSLLRRRLSDRQGTASTHGRPAPVRVPQFSDYDRTSSRRAGRGSRRGRSSPRAFLGDARPPLRASKASRGQRPPPLRRRARARTRDV